MAAGAEVKGLGDEIKGVEELRDTTRRGVDGLEWLSGEAIKLKGVCGDDQDGSSQEGGLDVCVYLG